MASGRGKAPAERADQCPVRRERRHAVGRIQRRWWRQPDRPGTGDQLHPSRGCTGQLDHRLPRGPGRRGLGREHARPVAVHGRPVGVHHPAARARGYGHHGRTPGPRRNHLDRHRNGTVAMEPGEAPVRPGGRRAGRRGLVQPGSGRPHLGRATRRRRPDTRCDRNSGDAADREHASLAHQARCPRAVVDGHARRRALPHRRQSERPGDHG